VRLNVADFQRPRLFSEEVGYRSLRKNSPFLQLCSCKSNTATVKKAQSKSSQVVGASTDVNRNSLSSFIPRHLKDAVTDQFVEKVEREYAKLKGVTELDGKLKLLTGLQKIPLYGCLIFFVWVSIGPADSDFMISAEEKKCGSC
jgi:hypothetical protein